MTKKITKAFPLNANYWCRERFLSGRLEKHATQLICTSSFTALLRQNLQRLQLFGVEKPTFCLQKFLRPVTEETLKMADAPPSLQKVRAACKKRGATGAKGLSRAFRIYDDDHSLTLNYDEFKTGLEDYGVNLSDEEVQELFSYFDRDGADGIKIDEFILAFRKPLEGSRLNVVKLAFKKADKTGDGVLTCDDLKKVYNAREHPKYKNGEYTEKQVFEEFLNNFEPENGKDGRVTEKEFIEYYSCLGASIDNDAYFDLMVRNAWKL